MIAIISPSPFTNSKGWAVAACEDRRITRVLRLVAHDLTRRHTLRDAAKVAGLEPAYFSRVFQRTTGLTFSEWSARVRVEEAKSMLRVLDASITSIAVSVGYTDVTTFERVFRRIERVTPRQYRALQRQIS